MVFPSQFRRLLIECQEHPEANSLAPDGTPCKADTSGLLQRADVTAGELRYVGPRSTVLTFAIRFLALRLRLGRRIRPWLICLATSHRGRRPHLLRSRSPGSLRRSCGLFQFQAQPSSGASKRTSEPLLSNFRPTIYGRLRSPPQRSQCKGLGTPKTSSK